MFFNNFQYAIFLILLIVADLVLLIGFMKDIDCEKQAKIDMDTAWQEYLHSNFRTMNNYQNAVVEFFEQKFLSIINNSF